MHRTLMAKARTMMADNDLPSNCWDELYCTAAYLHIRTPSSTVPKTPYEMFWKKTPDLSHLREIGAQAFILKQATKSKSKDQGFECIMVGYSQSAKAYRLYHRASHKFVESFHVNFIERKDATPISHHPGQIINAVDSNSPTVSTFHDPAPVSTLSIDSSSHSKNIVCSDSSSERIPSIKDDSPFSSSISPSSSSANVDPLSTSLPLPPPSTLHTNSLNNFSSSPPISPEPVLPKRVSKPSAKKCAAIEKQSALLTNISTFLSKLKAGNEDAATDLAYAFDDLAKLPDVTYDNSIPTPGDPKTYHEAMNSPDADRWMESMKEELASLKKYDVYELIPRSSIGKRRVPEILLN
jgi:hypothetical protein